MAGHIPGLGAPARTDLPVLLPCTTRGPDHAGDLRFSRWAGSASPWTIVLLLALVALWPFAVAAQGGYTLDKAFDALWRWMPFLVTKGFAMNILISFLTMAVGTLAGVVLGLWQVSPSRPVRRFAWLITQTFRNSPWLVLLFIVMLTFPFRIGSRWDRRSSRCRTGSRPCSDSPCRSWRTSRRSCAAPCNRCPTGQWEAAESLALSRRQTLWRIVLPQCFKRMIPPWMNWYAILTMATPLVSLLGVEEIVTLSRQAMEAENNHPELLIPFYGFALVIFFAYCYPIARWTISLERRFAVKL